MRNMIRARLADDSGVSLVELLVVIVLMGVIGGIGTTSMVRGMKVSAATQSRFDALADLQRSVDRMTRELRAAAPTQVGGAPVLLAQANRISVAVWRNNFTEQYRFTYQYCPDQQTLLVRREGPLATPPTPGTGPLLNCVTPTDPILITGISNNTPAPGQPMFRYFVRDPATGLESPTPTLTPTLSLVRKVEVNVWRSMPDLTTPIKVTTMVRLRNAR